MPNCPKCKCRVHVGDLLETTFGVMCPPCADDTERLEEEMPVKIKHSKVQAEKVPCAKDEQVGALVLYVRTEPDGTKTYSIGVQINAGGINMEYTSTMEEIRSFLRPGRKSKSVT